MIRHAILLGFAGALTCACGADAPPPGPTLALNFSGCSFSGSLAVAKPAGKLVPLSSGLCGGGAFDGGGRGTGVDVFIDIGQNNALHLTFNAKTVNLPLAATAIPATLDDQANFLGGDVPEGVAWVRHRQPPALGGNAPVFAPVQGTVTVTLFTISPSDCTREACEKGTTTIGFDLDLHWSSPTGVVGYSGQVAVTGTSGDAACKTSSDCPAGAGLMCNRGAFDTQSSCGPTNATGALLGQVCSAPSDCQSNACEPLTRQCTLFCGADADCGNGTSCEQNDVNPWNECIRSCQRNADCAGLPTPICVVHGSADFKTLLGGCGGAKGTTPFAKQPTAGNGCETNLPYGGVCTRLCQSAADCAAPLVLCSVVDVPTTQIFASTGPLKICH